MDNQNLIIYEFNSLYQILKELEEDLNYHVIEISDKKFLKVKTANLQNYLIVTQRNISNINRQVTIEKVPIKVSKLIEKFNIELLKQTFNEKSEMLIGDYKINLNSREIYLKDLKLKLTEKETNIITYLSKLKIPANIDELQFYVWGYKSELETHTVETHIYRLRKKILKVFKDKNFIISTKNGYQIN